MNTSIPIINVDSVSKEYKLGAYGGTTLRDALERLSCKIFKKEDPFLKIGTNEQIIGKKFLALNNISFTINPGERVGIIGHNGAGKSTLLKLISQITIPSSGEIGLNGRVESMLEVGTGFHGELTGRENIYLNGSILGMSKKEIDSKLNDIIEFSEVGDFIDIPVKRYSSGMFVKLGFSVAAHLDSEIMIMDEVLAVGDMAFQKKCISKMNQISKEKNRTILYVSHNMATIRALCTRCIVLEHGKIIFDGDVEKAISLYTGNDGRSKAEITFTDDYRKSFNYDGKVRVNKIIFSEQEELVFEYNQTIKTKLEIEAFEDLTDFYFRFPILNTDNSRIGTIHSSIIPLLKKGRHSYNFSLSFSNLMPGTYSLWIIARTKKMDFGMPDHDVISHAINFEIVNNRQENFIPDGNYSGWGPINFPKADIREED